MTRVKRPGTIGLVTTKLEAVYENGVFRPLTRPEGDLGLLAQVSAAARVHGHWLPLRRRFWFE